MLYEFKSEKDFADAVAKDVSAYLAETIASNGSVSLALSGGNTPKIYYPAIAKKYIDWSKVKVFFADERMVPNTSADSNYGLAGRLLFADKKNINCWPVDASLSAKEAAEAYAKTLTQQLPQNASGMPVLDVAILGVGGDGHVASLFADSMEADGITTTASASGFERVSIGMQVLLAAKRVVIAVSDKNKAHIIERVVNGTTDSKKLPVDMLKPDGKRVFWFYCCSK